MIRLREAQTSTLIRQPESGMGYQIVDVDYHQTMRRATVYNGELLLWEREPQPVLLESYESLLESASTLEAQSIRSMTVVRRPLTVSETFGKTHSGQRLDKPAIEGEPKVTTLGELFARFTAYMNDRRITADRGLTPGTYATTAADAARIRTGSQAVERYALPDPRPAVYRFPVRPGLSTAYRQGIVQPAFGHRGGGDEVIFDKGTGPNTVSTPEILPP